MPRHATVHLVSLRSSLVNLPISIYGPLVERSVRPQSLAVHLTITNREPRTSACVGWTGLASASSLARFSASKAGAPSNETIEIDPQYAEALGFRQGDVVEIGLLHDLQVAANVGTEPIGPDDWEIIETHATHIETALLSQARVAHIGQEIDVWVLGRTRVRLRVVSLSPTAPALLLSADTEVSVAPKLHKQPSSRIEGVQSGSGLTAGDQQVLSQTLRLLPSHLLPDLHLPTKDDKGEQDEVIGFVTQKTFALLSGLEFPLPSSEMGTYTLSSSSASTSAASSEVIKCSKFLLKTHIRRIKPPSDPSEPQSRSPSGSEDINVDGARLGDLGKIIEEVPAEKEKAKGDKAREMTVWIMYDASNPPPGLHIVLLGKPGDENQDHVQDWDLVKLTATSKRRPISQVLAYIPSAASEAPTGAGLAGIDTLLSQGTDWCLRQFALHSMRSSVCGVSTLLITGNEGAGKTSVVQTIAKRMQENPKTFTYVHYIDISRYTNKSATTIKALFKYWFDTAYYHRPSIIIMDNLHSLLPPEAEHAESFRTRQLTELFLEMYGSSNRAIIPNARAILLLATAPSKQALHPLLSRMHIFSEVIHLRPPNKDARKEILAYVLDHRLRQSESIQIEENAPINYALIATRTEGYSAMDLTDLVSRAIHIATARSDEENGKTILKAGDFEAAQTDFVPINLRDIKLHKSDVLWSDIGGLREPRRILRETLEWPTKYARIYAQSPLRLRSGLLLYGFPGCGKTLLASAVAKECGLNFISVKGPEVLSKYIGASEKSVRDLFDRAQAAKPCVLFFDEFDSIAPRRGHDSTGVTDRVVNQMLTQMDGVEGLQGVYVLAATSRPDLIDPALLRPGRLDKSVYCNMPDRDERKEILQSIAHKVDVSTGVDWDEIAEQTEEFSGADLQALVYNAHLEVVQSTLASNKKGKGPSDETQIQFKVIGGPTPEKVRTCAEDDALRERLKTIRDNIQGKQEEDNSTDAAPLLAKQKITQEHLRKALKKTRPSVSRQERQRLSRIYADFVGDRKGALTTPPDAGGVGHRVSLM